MSDNHKSLSANVTLRILEQNEDLFGLLIQNIWESVEQVTYSYDDIGFNSKIYLRSQQLEEEVDVSCANI